MCSTMGECLHSARMNVTTSQRYCDAGAQSSVSGGFRIAPHIMKFTMHMACGRDKKHNRFTTKEMHPLWTLICNKDIS